MHSIERYGIVALLFLFVTIVAVLMWDSDETKSASHGVAGVKDVESVATAPTAGLDSATPERAEKGAGRRRLRLSSEPQPGPLFRDPPATTTEVAGDAQGAPLEHESHAGEAQLQQEAPPTTLTPREQPAPESVIAKATTHEYTVRTGDTLSAIAQRELGSARRWEELVAANPGLDPAKLRVGKKIQVPGASAVVPSEPRTAAVKTTPKDAPEGAAKTAPKSASRTAPVATGKTWKVGKGENLWKIAARALGDGKRWGEIVAVNPGLNPDRLVLGQVLALPASAKLAGKSPQSAQQGTPKSAPPRSTKTAPLVASVASDRSTRAGGKVK